MKRRASLAAVLILTLAFMGESGCRNQQTTLALLTQTLGNAVASLAQISGNTELADTLKKHTEIAVGIIKGWRPGMSPDEAIRAINQIIDDIKLFPAIGPYRPLITLALGTAASIIELLSRGGPERPHTDVRLTKPPHDSREFRRDWDAIRAGGPGMEKAPIL